MIKPTHLILKIPKRPRIVEIHWTDADFDSAAYDEGEKMTQGVLVPTVGYLVAESKNFVSLAVDAIGGKYARHVMNIPKAAIVKRRVLR